MLGTYITFPELLILIPLLAGILCFWWGNSARNIAFWATILTLATALGSWYYSDVLLYNAVSYSWLKYLGASYHIAVDSFSIIPVLLLAITYPLIIGYSMKRNISNPSRYFGLLMLSMAGIMGVFLAMDALVFYFFWELALIPVYFLSSMWGGERRVQATWKFFIYTFAGSLLMLIGIIYIYLHTTGRSYPDGASAAHTFNWFSFISAQLTQSEQSWLFWLFFVAFAIKMPVFPFHTWQPDTYDQADTVVTMVLSGIMVKMGIYGVIKWLIPVLKMSSVTNSHFVILLSVIGIIYASLLALRQNNLKRLAAYSSIAHIGLMCAAAFSMNNLSGEGLMSQIFSHGINIIGIWMVIDIIERKTGFKTISDLGGLAQKAPALAIFAVIFGFANIALPLTNAFIGEFLMFSGLWKFEPWYAVAACSSVIIAAAYTLNMIRKVFYGPVSNNAIGMSDISFTEKVIFSCLTAWVFIVGIYPQPLIEAGKKAVEILSGVRQ